MEKISKPRSIDDLLTEAKVLTPRLAQQEMYRSENQRLFQTLKDYWYTITQKAGDIVIPALRGAPGGTIGYVLWKMPTPLHATVNRMLDSITYACAYLNPGAELATGLSSALSKLVYGIKTRSSDEVISGLIGATYHLKEIDHPKIQQFSEEAHEILAKYFTKKQIDSTKKSS